MENIVLNNEHLILIFVLGLSIYGTYKVDAHNLTSREMDLFKVCPGFSSC